MKNAKLAQDDQIIARKLNFNGEVSTQEMIRISEELFKDENIFVSHLFKTEYLTYDKNAKGYLIKVDMELFKVFTRLTNLIKLNNTFNVNTVNDFYILQLLVLESDYSLCFNQRDQVIGELRKKEETLRTKENQIAHLEERLRFYSNDLNLSNRYEIEIKALQMKLLEKSNELMRMEIVHGQKEKNHHIKLSQVLERNKLLQEENLKMKELLKELASNLYTNSNTPTALVDKISIILEDNNHLNNSNLSVEATIEDESIEGENFLVTKVIGDFDKIVDNELKKVEGYYRKESNVMKRKSSAGKFKSTGEKNYVEWKTRNSAVTWADSLRGRSDHKGIVDVNVNEMKKDSKIRIKNSIVADSKSLEQTLKSDLDISKTDIWALSEVYSKRMMTRSSSPTKRYKRKIENNDKLWREKFDGDIRKLLFSYKKK